MSADSRDKTILIVNVEWKTERGTAQVRAGNSLLFADKKRAVLAWHLRSNSRVSRVLTRSFIRIIIARHIEVVNLQDSGSTK